MAYTNIDDPSANFQVALYTGNSGTLTVTNDGNSDLQPDLVWTKKRSGNSHHALVDSSRGTSKQIYSNLTAVEGTVSGVNAFNTDGFTLGSNGTANLSGATYVAWQWKVNAGTTSSNTNGSITSTVQANQDAGFSIVTYTGTGSAATVGHGLGDTPDMIIVKNRTTAVDWAVYHKNLTDAGYVMQLNTTDAQIDSGTNRWNHTDPTSSVFSVGSGQQTNQNTNNMVAYCFASKQGYSKFGKYVGNGNSLGDGPFIYTGFAPSFVIIKRTDAANDWIMHTYKLGTKASSGIEKGNVGNLNNTALRANENSFVDDWGAIDMLSNGFKIRTDAASENTSGGSYIYMAFAENPFTTSTGIPTTAR